MNLVELFIEFLDQIYYPGYALGLAGSDPEKYNWEFAEFANNYGADQ